MKIGEIAKRTNLPVQTIRFYENEKLIKSIGRTEGNFRLYDSNVIEQLQFIKHSRNLDLSLNEIKHLIELQNNPTAGCEEVSNLIKTHISQVEVKMKELAKLKIQLHSLTKACATEKSIENCGIIKKIQTTS